MNPYHAGTNVGWYGVMRFILVSSMSPDSGVFTGLAICPYVGVGYDLYVFRPSVGGMVVCGIRHGP